MPATLAIANGAPRRLIPARTGYQRRRNEAERTDPRGRRALGGPEAAAGQRGDQIVTTRLLVVPRERDLAHQVRVRLLEAGVVAERCGEAADTAFAADAGHLERLGLD